MIVMSQENPDDIVEELQQVIVKLHTHNPSMIIFIAKLIPTPISLLQECIDAVNDRLDTLAFATLAGPLVHVVDMTTDFDASTDLWDSLHPNNQGSEKMAHKSGLRQWRIAVY